ncbi:MAG: cyclic nucleotide-binding domain-containing protein [Gammaproteobacteria bacterium]|nr:cyclic nucleotide-binding domain-containing protein [Gammaproteobacteria bacterium]
MNLCMDIEDKLVLLKEIDLFKSFQEATLRVLCEQCNETYLNNGDILFQEGSTEDSMYLILMGKMMVYKRNRQIAELGPGAYLGEMALIDSKPRSASAKALSETLLIEVSRFEYDQYLTAEPMALRSMIQTLSSRIRNDLQIISADIKSMSILAHDMRHCLTPLGLVEGFFEDQVERIENGATREIADEPSLEQLRNQLALVVRVTDELSCLISQSLGRIKKINVKYELERASIVELVEESVSDYARHPRLHDISIQLRVDAPVAMSQFNRMDIRRVLHNLIINAAEASAPGDTITISVLQLDGKIEVAVQDQGPGIDEELKSLLFTETVTTKEDGVGLGLLSCKEIIEDRHQGTLSFVSDGDQGARFYFTLPTD